MDMAPLPLPVPVPEGAGAAVPEPGPEAEPPEGAGALPPAVGTANPVMLPEKGPGAALAEAPGPVRAGAVADPVKEGTALAEDWNAWKLLPLSGTLIPLPSRLLVRKNLGREIRSDLPNHSGKAVRGTTSR